MAEESWGHLRRVSETGKVTKSLKQREALKGGNQIHEQKVQQTKRIIVQQSHGTEKKKQKERKERRTGLFSDLICSMCSRSGRVASSY